MMKTLLIIAVIAIATIEISILIRFRYDDLIKRIWRACQQKPTNTIFPQKAIVGIIDTLVEKYEQSKPLMAIQFLPSLMQVGGLIATIILNFSAPLSNKLNSASDR